MSQSPLAVAVERWRRQQSVRQHFDDLEAYVTLFEATIRRERAGTEADAALTNIFTPDQFSDDDAERYQESVRRLDETFSQTLRASAVGVILSTLEIELIAIAQFLAWSKSTALPESFGKGKGPPLWKAKTFFDGLSTSFEQNHWPILIDFLRVRNALLHNRGVVDSGLHEFKETVEATNRLPSVEVADERIILNGEAATNFLSAAKFHCLALLRL